MPFDLTNEALAAAEAETDPGSLAAATRLRARFGPELAAAAAAQVELRRRARTKFGDAAKRMFFTRDGLEQASRPEVADYHAQRFVDEGVRRVVDVGCGIGSDSLGFARAGLEVLAIELDQQTAGAAAANLAGVAEVVCADVELDADRFLTRDSAVFCDPARRTASGRVWRVEDLRPSWSFVKRVLDRTRVAVVKLGPALPQKLIPAGVEAEWISHRGETVEVCLCGSPSSTPRRSALILPHHRLIAPPVSAKLSISRPLSYIYEPDGAVIRAGAVAVLGQMLGAALLDPSIAYLTSAQLTSTPYASAFAVERVLPYDPKVLRSWVTDEKIGILEIKKRGIDVDPARLRRQLRPRGPANATLILSRTNDGARAIVARRIPAGTP